MLFFVVTLCTAEREVGTVPEWKGGEMAAGEAQVLSLSSPLFLVRLVLLLFLVRLYGSLSLSLSLSLSCLLNPTEQDITIKEDEGRRGDEKGKKNRREIRWRKSVAF